MEVLFLPTLVPIQASDTMEHNDTVPHFVTNLSERRKQYPTNASAHPTSDRSPFNRRNHPIGQYIRRFERRNQYPLATRREQSPFTRLASTFAERRQYPSVCRHEQFPFTRLTSPSQTEAVSSKSISLATTDL